VLVDWEGCDLICPRNYHYKSRALEGYVKDMEHCLSRATNIQDLDLSIWVWGPRGLDVDSTLDTCAPLKRLKGIGRITLRGKWSNHNIDKYVGKREDASVWRGFYVSRWALKTTDWDGMPERYY